MYDRIEVAVRPTNPPDCERLVSFVDEVRWHRPIVDTTRDADTNRTHRVSGAAVMIAVQRDPHDPDVNRRIDRALRIFDFALKDEG